MDIILVQLSHDLSPLAYFGSELVLKECFL
jgi:hypothetical protein